MLRKCCTTVGKKEDSETQVEEYIEIPFRRSQREKQPVLSINSVINLNEFGYNIGQVNDPMTFGEAI